MSDPAEWASQFERRLNAGDLDGVIALYAPDATFIPPDGGDVVVGRDAVRAVLAGLIARKAELHGRVVREVLRRSDDGAWRLIVGHPNARG